MENAMSIYMALSHPPREALKTITGGKLNGKTDINPQWRYKAMTEQFGLVGIGWKYEVQKLWTEQGAGNEKLSFAQVAVFVKDGDKWSEPIVGIGGSRLVATEKGTAVSNDEGYKMAVTDAFSTALKMLGVAAAIYEGRWDGSKYNDLPQESRPRPEKPPLSPKEKKRIEEIKETMKGYLDAKILPPKQEAAYYDRLAAENLPGLESCLAYVIQNYPLEKAD